MAKDPALLRKRFLRFVDKNWSCWNTYGETFLPIGCFSAVYLFASRDFKTNEADIVYAGSTTNLMARYKSHKIPGLIHKDNLISVLYFRPMSRGFYDYEMKLIKKLSPRFNVQHKTVLI